MSDSTVSVILRGIEIDANVGVHAWEKHPERPTRLVIDLTLLFKDGTYFTEGGGYVDYDPLRAYIKSLAGQPHEEKLETIAAKILKSAFATTPAKRVKLKILKPDIFNDVREVGLEFDVKRGDRFE